MQNTLTLRVLPQIAAQDRELRRYVAGEMAIDARTICDLRIRRRSIDARQRTIYVNLTVDVYVNETAPETDFAPIEYPDVSRSKQAIVVGAGPAGLFAALRLIELGLRPIVLERGKDVHERRKDIALISREHRVDPESNYSFGEGGAGAYSDGKLYTRSKKRGNVERILRVFCQHGAHTDILCDAHPHIGTDRLPRIIEAMREQIRKSGGEVYFQSRVDALLMQRETVCGVRLENGREYQGPVILATGHSARDVYRYLKESGIQIEAKGIAVGVRLEHPAYIIDCIQYHNSRGRGRYLPAAEYSFVTHVDDRGVYSFCMCPGGFVIPAATGPEQLVVNGMSPSNRGTAWSNSGMVVETHPEDVAQFVKEHQAVIEQQEMKAQENSSLFTPHSSLQMMYFQEFVEKQCWQQGNMKQTAPAQRMADFVNNRLSYDLPKSSYAPGLISSPLHFWMPSFVSKRLQEGFKTFGKNAHGFLTNEATLIAMETRTSSPVRIVRDRETLQHVRILGLFPCGEGAGYAGGIVSAGVDGERCAEMCAEYLKQQ